MRQSIAVRLTLGYAVTLLSLVVIAGLALAAFSRLFHAVSFIQTHHMREAAVFEDIRLLMADAVDEDLAFVLSGGEQGYNQSFQSNIEEIRRQFATHTRLHVSVMITPPEIAGMSHLRSSVDRLIVAHGEVVRLIQIGRLDDARRHYNERSRVAAREALATASQLVDFERIESDELADAARAEAGRTHRLILIIVVAAAVVGGTVAFSVTRSVAVPVAHLLTLTQRVDRGSLEIRSGLRGEDEIGRLAQGFDRMVARLEAVFAEQERFLADVSHELRTPITIVRGHLDLLRRGSRGPEHIERATTIGIDELDRMGRLVNDLLVLARSSRTDFLAQEIIAVPGLLRDVLRKAEGIAQRPWRLGPVAEASVNADRDRLTQALLNLLRNAAEHTRQDDPIEISATCADGTVRITVVDRGEGIPADVRPHVFERFYRGKQAESRVGLGLNIVQAIARAHGGDVTVESGERVGTSFVLSLPAASPRVGAGKMTRS